MTTSPSPSLPDRLRAALSDVDPGADALALLHALLQRDLDQLPFPAAGGTLQRWQALSAVAEHDLSLAKLYEGHTDALAILRELGDSPRTGPGAIWGVWAAESPEGRTTIEPAADGGVWVLGTKCWCSGAALVSHALVTAWYADGRGPQLVRIAIRQPAVDVIPASWPGLGMAGSATLDVAFRRASGHLVGGPGDYVSRPGFWHGGAGIAACWYGGALALAAALRRAILQAPAPARSAFRLAALGKVDLSLQATAALLRDAARWIDLHPLDDARATALRVRLAAEDSARHVLDEAGRALGAAPFCRDPHFARAAADLPVFVRQSHAERDFAALGERLLSTPESPWQL